MLEITVKQKKTKDGQLFGVLFSIIAHFGYGISPAFHSSTLAIHASSGSISSQSYDLLSDPFQLPFISSSSRLAFDLNSASSSLAILSSSVHPLSIPPTSPTSNISFIDFHSSFPSATCSTRMFSVCHFHLPFFAIFFHPSLPSPVTLHGLQFLPRNRHLLLVLD